MWDSEETADEKDVKTFARRVSSLCLCQRASCPPERSREKRINKCRCESTFIDLNVVDKQAQSSDKRGIKNLHENVWNLFREIFNFREAAMPFLHATNHIEQE